MRKPERVSHLAQGGKGDVEESTEFLSAATRRSFDDVHGGGERSAARLRGEPVALVIAPGRPPAQARGIRARREAFRTVTCAPEYPERARTSHHSSAWRVTKPRSTSTNLLQPPQPPPASVRQSPRRWGTGARRGTTGPPGASFCPLQRA